MSAPGLDPFGFSHRRRLINSQRIIVPFGGGWGDWSAVFFVFALTGNAVLDVWNGVKPA